MLSVIIDPIRGAIAFGMAILSLTSPAQCDGWQQHVDYSMDIELDVRTHRYTGSARLTYTNNSPDTLKELFFHLYPNAFRPGSEMDVKSRTIEDPDSRIGDRISDLEPHQMGGLTVERMSQQGKEVPLEHIGTVLKVTLPRAVLPSRSTTLEYRFVGQVPVQIRRSGRNNSEGIAYTMTQWYPKLAEYDERGWHAYPYVAREFHGVWGDFDVRITLDSAYTIASTGTLLDPHRVGHGYPLGKKRLERPSGDKLTWHFQAKKVHDFAWAADKEYVHSVRELPDGRELHFFHRPDQEIVEVWDELPVYMEKAMAYMDEHFGAYPWPRYSFVQGGDGGMEYPMLTMITGKRRLGSLVGVSVHEFVHSWYHGMMASNEGRYPWMDEGFTEYASKEVMAHLFPRSESSHMNAYSGYYALVESGKHEAPIVHADHFNTNFAYGVTAYNFGELFLNQLGAVIGEKNLRSGFLRYYDACKFKHPDPIDAERVFEATSGLELDWYFDEWVNTTRTLDIGIQQVLEVEGELHITLERIGGMVMPVDLVLVGTDDGQQHFHVPLSLALGSKSSGTEEYPFAILPAWQWTNPTYTFMVPGTLKGLREVILDPMRRTADVDRSNDRVSVPSGMGGLIRP